MSLNEDKRLNFYGRRVGRTLSDKQKEGLSFTKPFQIDLPQKPFSKMQWDELTKGRDAFFEIGFGYGEHVANLAERNPDKFILASEVYLNGVASLGHFIDDLSLSNIHIFADDVRKLLPCLPDDCFSKVFVLFPDPWHKKRHNERRILNHEPLKEIKRLLKKDGMLVAATDDPGYLEWIFDVVPQYFSLQEEIIVKPGDFVDSKIRQQTRYEQKALLQGRSCHFLYFQER